MNKPHGNTGKKHSDESRKKISLGLLGHIPWNKGLKTKGHPISEETKKKIGRANKGNTSWIKGKTHSLETRKKLSKAHSGVPRPNRRGKNCYLWKGGISPKNKAIRSSLEYQLWRKAVFERDDYTCIWCGEKSIKGKRVIIHADHIKPFALFPELRFAIDNGRTLCIKCHRTTDTYGIKSVIKKGNYESAR